MKTKYKITAGLVIVVLALLEKYLFLNHLNFNELLIQNLNDEGLTPEQIKTSQGIQQWVVPLSLIITLLSILIISGFLYLGTVLLNYQKNFKQIFFVVFLCESVIIFSKFINFIFLKMNLEHFNTTEHLKKFQVLSLQFLSPYTPTKEAIYSALGSVNLFQIAYWFALAYGLQFVINKSYWKAFELVLYSYISIYIFYVLGKLLFNLNFG